MDKQQARVIIKASLEDSFNKDRFTVFVKNLLNQIKDAPFTYRGNLIPDAYKPYITSLERIGKYTDGEHHTDILIVKLKKETSLERARTMQRNFIAWYLNGSRGGEMKDAALVAFVSPNEDDWRFSLVKMDYRFEPRKDGKVKVKEEFTLAKRWSFLVGKNESSHTAQSRLVPILADDEHLPTLAQLEEAFNIEKVTKEFFLKYRELFIRTKEELDKVVKNDPKIKADFEAKGVDTVNFAKKLLGQIVFLYFLQKKGWFGVGRDDDWGTGSKQFLRELFEKKHSDYSNFFNDILEPLFYEALRTGEDRKHEDYYYSRFNCKIPFLNGGLFDPINNYDWVHTDILLPNELFSNRYKTREGDTGNGILDIFDRYNFTVKEDEPLEKEVAIDPEMLGKVFENLLQVKDRKSKGTYYTPREIVHYMCRQSLINYLETELNKGTTVYQEIGKIQTDAFGNEAKVGQLNLTAEHKSSPQILKEDIETLIKYGEQLGENEAIAIVKEQSIKEGKQKSSDYKLKLPESIRYNAALIDDKLADITVCDPAVGSGAFPVGMMHEIVKARNLLSVYIKSPNTTIYQFKRECIEKSLYGVDIDPGAVEIAKLRLWLSLVVDEDDIENIEPLPNLDYRIMQGNSLISEFMGINFDTVREKTSKSLMFKDETDELTEQFQQKKDEFLNESNVTRKTQLKEDIDDLLVKIFEAKLEKQRADYFNRLKKIENKYSVLPNKEQRDEYIKQDKEKLYKESGFDLESAEKQLKEFTSGRKIKPFFLWNLYFPEVFHEKGGFDVVIANPPYVRADSPDFKEQRQAIMEGKSYKTLYEKWDLFVPFIEKGLKLLAVSGNLCFITSNSLCTSKFAFRILDYIQASYYTRFIDYFHKMRVFEAGVVPVVFGISRFKTKEDVTKTMHSKSFERISRQEKIPMDEFKKVGRTAFKPTHHSFKIKEETVKLGDICYISYGLRPNSDERYWRGEFTRNDLVSEVEDEIHIKPYIEGKNLSRYRIDKTLYLEWGTERCPKKLVRPTFPELYKNPKLLCGTMTGGTFDNTGIICNHSIVVFVRFTHLKGVQNKSISSSIKKFNTLPRCELEKLSEKFDLKYLIAVLNSKFANRFLNGIRRHRLENYFYPDDFRNMPIANTYPANQKPFVDLVDKILAITKDDDYLQNAQKQSKVKALQAEIDQLVYKLYGLTKAEIAIVEGR